jgi:hypothetical protein
MRALQILVSHEQRWHRSGTSRRGRRDGPCVRPHPEGVLRLSLCPDNHRLFAACGFGEVDLETDPGFTEPAMINMEKRLA